MSLGKIFVASSYADRTEMNSETDAIVTAIEQAGYEAVVFIREQVGAENPEALMQAAFARIRECQLMIANVTGSPRGVVLEMGVAAGANIPTIAIARSGTNDSTTASGTSKVGILYYDSAEQIPQLLEPVLSPYSKVERERADLLKEVNPQLLEYLIETAREKVALYHRDRDDSTTFSTASISLAADSNDQYRSLVTAHKIAEIFLRNAYPHFARRLFQLVTNENSSQMRVQIERVMTLLKFEIDQLTIDAEQTREINKDMNHWLFSEPVDHYSKIDIADLYRSELERQQIKETVSSGSGVES